MNWQQSILVKCPVGAKLILSGAFSSALVEIIILIFLDTNDQLQVYPYKDAL